MFSWFRTLPFFLASFYHLLLTAHYILVLTFVMSRDELCCSAGMIPIRDHKLSTSNELKEQSLERKTLCLWGVEGDRKLPSRGQGISKRWKTYGPLFPAFLIGCRGPSRCLELAITWLVPWVVLVLNHATSHVSAFLSLGFVQLLFICP